MIPLWMNQVIVNGMLEIKFGIFPAVKRRKRVFACAVLIVPCVVRFEIVHVAKIP
jgi:uncharacterized membrane protein